MRLAAVNFDIDRYINRFVPAPKLHLLPISVAWVLGYHAKPPPRIGNVVVWWWAFIGAFCGILVVEAVFRTEYFKAQGTPIVIASFGATAVLEYNTIDSPLAQPRNAFLGNIFAAVIGVGITKLFHLSSNFESLRFVAGALSVGVVSVFMGFTKTIHPPAGATALLCATEPSITNLGWFFLPLVILGTAILLAVACVLNNIERKFPIYWWTGEDLQKRAKDDIEKATDIPSAIGGSDTSENPKSLDTMVEGAAGKGRITIDRERIVVPDWLVLDDQERAMLDIFRARIRDNLTDTNR